jgi:hypothetical protein
VAALALAAHRPRLARDLALSGALAWVLAKLVKGLVGEARPSPCSTARSCAGSRPVSAPPASAARRTVGRPANWRVELDTSDLRRTAPVAVGVLVTVGPRSLTVLRAPP